jgi:hypothetical protein
MDFSRWLLEEYIAQITRLFLTLLNQTNKHFKMSSRDKSFYMTFYPAFTLPKQEALELASIMLMKSVLKLLTEK